MPSTQKESICVADGLCFPRPSGMHCKHACMPSEQAPTVSVCYRREHIFAFVLTGPGVVSCFNNQRDCFRFNPTYYHAALSLSGSVHYAYQGEFTIPAASCVLIRGALTQRDVQCSDCAVQHCQHAAHKQRSISSSEGDTARPLLWWHVRALAGGEGRCWRRWWRFDHVGRSCSACACLA